ncbi:MAG TPA: phosphatidate cytidylyltransferase [Sphingobacterium sp.]|nr:phosphatidate cytidylyltransferase [Sphingobacterium sp.]
MYWTLFYLVVVFFAVGAVAIVRLNKKSTAEQQRARWVKYVFYLITVSITILAIRYGYMWLLAMMLLFIGLFEILGVWITSRKRNLQVLLMALSAYGLIAYCFYRFSMTVDVKSILFVYMIVFTFDGFAQISGQLFGKRKILPIISPEKTVAGVVGGLIMGLSVGLVGLYMMWLNKPIIPWSWFMPLLICVGAFVGDALASWYKRICGIKDYSNMIPGHGGVLDRFDSFLFTGAMLFAGVIYWAI